MNFDWRNLLQLIKTLKRFN